MGGPIARGFPTLQTSNEFYGNQTLQKPDASVGGRRDIPGGPLLPTLPPIPSPDLYDMVANPVVNIIKKNVTNAVILTPSITGNGESWMVDWVCEEGTNTLLSNVYDIHQYMGNGGTPELAYQNVMPGTASSPGLLYPTYFPIRIKY